MFFPSLYFRVLRSVPDQASTQMQDPIIQYFILILNAFKCVVTYCVISHLCLTPTDKGKERRKVWQGEEQLQVQVRQGDALRLQGRLRRQEEVLLHLQDSLRFQGGESRETQLTVQISCR